jgi:hypothetical protein
MVIESPVVNPCAVAVVIVTVVVASVADVIAIPPASNGVKSDI